MELYFLALILSFVISGIIHIWIKIFGGKENYSKTYQIFTYSKTPGLIFSWIPILGYITWIYEIALLTIGTHKVHGIRRTKAILMYVIPLIIALVIILILAIAALYSMGIFMH